MSITKLTTSELQSLKKAFRASQGVLSERSHVIDLVIYGIAVEIYGRETRRPRNVKGTLTFTPEQTHPHPVSSNAPQIDYDDFRHVELLSEPEIRDALKFQHLTDQMKEAAQIGADTLLANRERLPTV